MIISDEEAVEFDYDDYNFYYDYYYYGDYDNAADNGTGQPDEANGHPDGVVNPDPDSADVTPEPVDDPNADSSSPDPSDHPDFPGDETIAEDDPIYPWNQKENDTTDETVLRVSNSANARNGLTVMLKVATKDYSGIYNGLKYDYGTNDYYGFKVCTEVKPIIPIKSMLFFNKC